MPGIAIESYLVEDLPAAAPPGFAVMRMAFAGLPGELALSDGWSTIFCATTGIARAWLDGDPAELVTGSDLEFVPYVAGGDGTARPAARLVIRRGGALLGALPLAAGVMGIFHAPSAMLEIVPLSWEIRAGAMRGGSPNGARMELAWRSRGVAGGVLTGGAARATGSSESQAALAKRIIVSAEGATGRNLQFLDTLTHRIMSRDEFVAEIRDGKFPGYEIRSVRGVATPVSRRTPTPDDNLG